MTTRLIVAALLVLAVVPSTGFAEDGSLSAPGGTLALHPYDRLPLAFEERPAPGDTPQTFVARGRGYDLVLTPAETTLALRPLPQRPPAGSLRLRPPRLDDAGRAPATVVRMRLIDAAPLSEAVPEAPQGHVNYLIGPDPSQWRTGIPTHARVRYRQVYPGVDLVYYGNQRRLEYDFVVAPGADPSRIALALEGPAGTAVQVRTDEGGDVVLGMPGGELRLRRPLIYQTIEGARRPVDGRFVAREPASRDGALHLTFEVAAYDRSRPLVIDPVLDYATYVGGTAGDAAMAIALDGARNAYVTGYTSSATFVPGGGAALGGEDAFVTKINATGTGVLYTTFLGGGGDDRGMAIAVDPSGNAYITGVTTGGFPTTANAAFGSPLGGDDAFLAKLGPSGSTLLYSTYLGGGDDDAGLGVAADASGNAWITGYTESATFPATVGGTTLGLPRDAFVARIDTSGSGLSSLSWARFLGGSGADEGHGIAVDSAAGVYVTGGTSSADFPTSSGLLVSGVQTQLAFKTTLSGAGTQDAFITRLDPTGAVLVYSTYFGGTGDDVGYAITVDSSKRAYVAGSTTSSAATFPLKNAFQATPGGGLDAFVARINTAASGSDSRQNTTFLGGSGDDVALGIAIDSANNAYVTGSTSSASGFPVVDAFAATFQGGATDAFVAKLTIAPPSGAVPLVYSTFLGGAGTDQGNGIALDSVATAYVAGTTSGGFPTTTGVLGHDPFGLDDAFVAKISQGPDLVISEFVVPGNAGSGAPLSVTITTTNQGEAAAGASTTRLYYSDVLTFALPPNCGGLAPQAPCAVELGTGSATGALNPGQSAVATLDVTLPANLSTGTHFLFAVADADGAVAEAIENNNRFSRSVLIGPDLTVSLLTVTVFGTTLTINDTTTNQGGADVTALTTTKFYLSSDNKIDAADGPAIGSRAVNPVVAAGASNAGSTQVTLTTVPAPGSYFIVAQADADNVLGEAKEDNNTRARSFQIGVDLAVTALTAPATSGPGIQVPVNYTIVNNGAVQSPATTLNLYFSNDTTLDAGDPLLTATVPSPIAIGALAPGTTASGTVQVTLPSVAIGTYAIIGKIDPDDTITETNENNNTRARTITLGSDLVAYFIGAPSTAAAGSPITISETVRNSGGAPVDTSFTVKVYRSPTTTFDAATAVELTSRTISSLAAGTTSAVSHPVTLDVATTPGSYFLILRVDIDDSVPELNEGNNALSKAITVTGPAQADLVVNFLNAPAGVLKDTAFNVSNTVKNTGTATAGDGTTPITVAIHLSTTTGVDGSVALLQTRTVSNSSGAPVSLAAGASNNKSTSVTIPGSVPSGNYFIVVVADADGTVPETSETNNTAAKAIGVSVPDFSVSALTVPSTGLVGGQISVSDTTRNTGLGDAAGSTTRYYLSLDATLDPATDPLIGSRPVGPLTRNATESGTATLNLPGGFVGNVFVIAQANGGGLPESNTTNNTLARAITLVGPDLVVSALTVPAGAGADIDITVTDSVTNVGGAAAADSVTRFYFSTDATLDGADVELNGSRAVLGLAAGAASSGPTTLRIPASTPTGKYFVIARADATGAVVETDEANNILARPINIGPDYVVQSMSSPSASGAGLAITINESTKNQGAGVTATTMTRYYLSPTATLTTGFVELGSRQVDPLGTGLASSASKTVTIPSNTVAGSYYIVARADADNAISDEVDETNNTNSRAIAIGPDLQVSAVTAPASAGAGKVISVSDTTINDGAGSTGVTTRTRYYLSTIPTLDGSAVPLSPDREVPVLVPRGKSSGGASVTLPASIAGTFYIIARADADGIVGELDEANNTRARVIEIGPDVTVSALNAASAITSPGTLSVTVTTKNVGSGTAAPSVTKFYLSADSALDAAVDRFLGDSAPVPQLAAGASSTSTTSVAIPDGIGGQFFLIAAATQGGAGEVDTGNNTRAKSLAVGPDFVVTALTAPGAAGANVTILVSESTRNSASAASTTPSTTSYYLSPTTTLAPDAVPFASRTVPILVAGGTSAVSNFAITLPPHAPTGRQYLIAKADGPNAVPELDESNNIRARAIDIGPDLSVSDLVVPTAAAAGTTIQVTDTTLNSGAGAAAAPFVVSFYLSANVFVDAGDIFLKSRQINGLAAGAADTKTTAIDIPPGVAGRLYIVARADDGGAIPELNESDNVNAKAVLIGPDLVVSTLSAPTSTTVAAFINVTDTTLNQGAGSTDISTTTVYYLSTDNVLDTAVDVPIGSRIVPPLAAGASHVPAAPTSVQIPPGTAPGSYFIIAKADGDSQVPEASEINNVRTRAITINP